MLSEQVLLAIEEHLGDIPSIHSRLLYVLTSEIRELNLFLEANPEIRERYKEFRERLREPTDT